jgi:hypothetical protein
MKIAWIIAGLVWFLPTLHAGNDLDRDGIDDFFEGQVLEKFRPAFMISLHECDGLPAEFQASVPEPRVAARNGTVYGQMFKNGNAHYELHYYHLWERDCGPAGHDLDTEHVSALVSSQNLEALYWYAAAHEDTVCDASRGARAGELNATEQGPRVWISHGKHASYLTESGWGLGCGGDTLDQTKEFKPTRLINIGEPNWPLNGAIWIRSHRWPLAARMKPDFTDARVDRLANPERTGVVAMNDAIPPFKAALLGGHWGAKSFVLANAEAGSKTGKALLLAGRKSFGWLLRKRTN